MTVEFSQLFNLSPVFPDINAIQFERLPQSRNPELDRESQNIYGPNCDIGPWPR